MFQCQGVCRHLSLKGNKHTEPDPPHYCVLACLKKPQYLPPPGATTISLSNGNEAGAGTRSRSAMCVVSSMLSCGGGSLWKAKHFFASLIRKLDAGKCV